MTAQGWARYWERRTPVEAMLLTNANAEQAAKWCGGTIESVPVLHRPPVVHILVPGLRGPTKVYVGSYLVRDSNGVFSAVDNHYFEQVYEKMKSVTYINHPEGARDVV